MTDSASWSTVSTIRKKRFSTTRQWNQMIPIWNLKLIRCPRHRCGCPDHQQPRGTYHHPTRSVIYVVSLRIVANRKGTHRTVLMMQPTSAGVDRTRPSESRLAILKRRVARSVHYLMIRTLQTQIKLMKKLKVFLIPLV